MNSNTKTRFQWVEQNYKQWLGIIELTGEFGMETFRIKIENLTTNNINYSHYKFERFNFETRCWTMSTIKSNYYIIFFRVLEEKLNEYQNQRNPENIVITFRVNSKNRETRMNLYRIFCKRIERKGYLFIENEQPTFTALMCFKNKTIIKLNKNNELNLYLNQTLQTIEFYN